MVSLTRIEKTKRLLASKKCHKSPIHSDVRTNKRWPDKKSFDLKKTCKKLCIRIGFTFSWKSPNGFFQMAMCCQSPWMVGEVDCFSYAATSECCFDMFVTLRAETPKLRNTWIFQDDHTMSQPPKNTKRCRNNGELYKQHTKAEHKNWFLAVSFDGERRALWVTFQWSRLKQR